MQIAGKVEEGRVELASVAMATGGMAAAATATPSRMVKVAVAQMTAVANVDANFATCARLVQVSILLPPRSLHPEFQFRSKPLAHAFLFRIENLEQPEDDSYSFE